MMAESPCSCKVEVKASPCLIAVSQHSVDKEPSSGARTRTNSARTRVTDQWVESDKKEESMGAPEHPRKRSAKGLQKAARRRPANARPVDDPSRKRAYPHRWNDAETESLMTAIRMHGNN